VFLGQWVLYGDDNREGIVFNLKGTFEKLMNDAIDQLNIRNNDRIHRIEFVQIYLNFII
jgi:hypothetical protein